MAPQKSAEHAALGLVIRGLREQRGWSQWELADQVGVHPNYVGGVERGEVNPSFGNLLKLADTFDIRASELLRRAEKLTSR